MSDNLVQVADAVAGYLSRSFGCRDIHAHIAKPPDVAELTLFVVVEDFPKHMISCVSMQQRGQIDARRSIVKFATCAIRIRL